MTTPMTLWGYRGECSISWEKVKKSGESLAPGEHNRMSTVGRILGVTESRWKEPE